MFEVFERLSCKAAKALGTKYYRLGSLCAIDSSLVDATLSMEWVEPKKIWQEWLQLSLTLAVW
jgi:hypothetical protein